MPKLRLLACFIMLISVWACSPKVSPLSTTNRFLKNFNIHILNDSLQLHLFTPADIKYSSSQQSIRQELRQNKIKTTNPVLIYGNTKDPAYHFVVTIGKEKEKARSNQRILDTIINEKHLHFLAISSDNKGINDMEIDLHNIYKRIKSGPQYLQDTGSVMSVVNRSMSSNIFLKDLTEIQQYPLPKNQGNSLELQMQLTFASFLENNPLYHDLINQIESPIKLKDSIVNVVKGNEILNDKVLDRIVTSARSTAVVMINENHFYPAHRAFILDLLPRLRAEGYTHLALEALGAPADSLLNKPSGFPALSTGFYTREQTYGNLLREAKKLGYQFVAYENMNSNKERELGQAENLYHKTIGTDKSAKVVVIAGIDHILERPTNSGKKWMATLFKELYHIDPLTISQTHLNLYRKHSGSTYQLLTKKELEHIANISAVDYFLLNNKQNDFSSWKEKLTYANRFDHLVQVSAFYKSEMKKENDYHQNIPYFTALVPMGKSITIPFHREHATLLVVYDKLGNVLEKKPIN